MKALALILAAAVTASSADWPHYRGLKMDGSTAESVAAWPAGGPRELWRVQLGTGHSGMTVAGGRVFSAGYKDGREVLQCLDAATGKTLWEHGWAAKIGNYLFEGGPRGTPTVDDGRVFLVGADGHVVCADASSGKVIWEKELAGDFGGRRMDWGFSCSPTVDGDRLLLDAGGKDASTVALNKATGAVIWKSGDDEPGYASPLVAQVGGARTVIMFKADALVGLAPESGKELWRFPWRTDWKANCATPAIVDDIVVISAAYNHGAAGVRIGAGKAEQAWFTVKWMAHFNSPVVRDGHVFGIDGEVGRRSSLVCLDGRTGDVKWRAAAVKNGSLILAGDKLIVLSEMGDLILAEATAKEFRELGRKAILPARCWVQPTLANGVLFCRNNKGELVALEMK